MTPYTRRELFCLRQFTDSVVRSFCAPKMRSFSAFLFFLYLVVHNGAFEYSSWPNDVNGIDFWDESAEKSKSSQPSESSYSSSSSSSSDSSGAFQVKVEQYEQKTDKSGTHEVTKTYEKKKPARGNETSSSKTVEVFRFPNGTIQRKVKDNGPVMKAECVKSKDCGPDKFCRQLTYQCEQCLDDFGCFSDDQCCGAKVCKFGRCITKPEHTGLARSPCDDDSQCKSGLYCAFNVFEGGKCADLRKEGESCNKGMFSRVRPKCVKGLECVRARSFGFFVNYKCMKQGSVKDKSSSGSPFDWFDDWQK